MIYFYIYVNILKNDNNLTLNIKILKILKAIQIIDEGVKLSINLKQ